MESESKALGPAEMSPLLALAVEKNLSVEGLEKLVALQERVMERQAAREFAAAMAAFQEACPPIPKTSTAKVTTKSGGSYGYAYAELDQIARTVRPILHKHGLAYSWDSKLSEDGRMIRATCVLTHANGHIHTADFEAPTESLTGAMSPQQKVAAALTYARRQALISVLGLTTCDPDTDAAPEDVEPVSAEQVLMLESLLDQRPSGSREKLLAWAEAQWGARTLEEIPAARFEWLKADLERKIKEQG